MIISKQICSYCSNESEIPQEFQEREPSSNSTQETGSNTTVVFSANSSQNSLHTFRIGGGFFVGVEFKYANINVNSTSGSKVTPTEHFYCKDEDLKLPREPSSNSTQETGSNTTVVFSANSSQNSLHTFRIGGGFFVGVEFKYANINVNSTSGSKVTPTEHFYCKDEDLKLPRVSFAVILCSLFWDKPWNCSFATRFTLLLLNYRYQFFRQRFYTNFT